MKKLKVLALALVAALGFSACDTEEGIAPTIFVGNSSADNSIPAIAGETVSIDFTVTPGDAKVADNDVVVTINGVVAKETQYTYENGNGTITCAPTITTNIVIEATDKDGNASTASVVVEVVAPKSAELGGSSSTLGSFYTSDNGVQTKTQLGENATKVVFCYSDSDGNKIYSGTTTTNEIVKAQASETKFAEMSALTGAAYMAVTPSANTITVAKDGVYAFSNSNAKGFFKVLSIASSINIEVYTVE